MSLSAVARKAGVSVSTVSRYVRGELQLRETTARQIDAAMDALGYCPPSASPRRARAALIVPTLTNPYFSDLAQAATQAAVLRKLTTWVLVSGGVAEKERDLVAHAASVDDLYGIFYIGMTQSNPVLSKAASSIPTVVLDEPLTLNDPSIPFIGADNFSGAYQATTYLLSLGHRYIAHIGGPTDLLSAQERLKGYCEALADANIEPRADYIFRGPYTEVFGAGVLTYITRLHPRPTALMVSSDIVAIGLLSAAEQYRISVPKDLSIIGFDGIEFGAWVRPQLTTVAQPVTTIVKAAYDAMDELHDNHHPESQFLPMELKIRQSCMAPGQDWSGNRKKA